MKYYRNYEKDKFWQNMKNEDVIELLDSKSRLFNRLKIMLHNNMC